MKKLIAAPLLRAACLSLALPLAACLALDRAAAADPNAAGKWKILVRREEQTRDYYLDLKQDGAKITGTFFSPRSGDNAVRSGTFAAGVLRVEVLRGGEGEEALFVIEAKSTGKDRFEGKLSVNDTEVGDVEITRVDEFPARREGAAPPAAVAGPAAAVPAAAATASPAAAVAGTWAVLSKSPDGSQEYESTIEVSAGPGGMLTGKGESQLGVALLRAVKLDGKSFGFEMTLTIDGNAIDFIVRAELKDPKTLAGRWTAKERDDVTGEWGAKLVKPAAPPALAPPARAHPAAGSWFAKTRRPNGEGHRFRLVLKIDGKSVAGRVEIMGRATDIKRGEEDGAKLHFVFDHEVDGRKHEVQVSAELDAASGTLRGRWTVAGENESGDWVGRRATEI